MRIISQFIHNNNKIDNLPNCTIEHIDKLIDNYSEAIEKEYPYILPQYNAYLWILKRISSPQALDFSDIISLHWCINKHINPNSGMLRNKQIVVREYNCPDYNELEYFIDKFNNLLSILDDIKKLGENKLNLYFWYIHNVLQCIHPFNTGNGRVGRFFFNMLRVKCDIGISIWDVEKDYYFDAIKEFEKTFIERYITPRRNYGLDKIQFPI